MSAKALLAVLTVLSFISCKQTPEAGKEQEAYYKRLNEQFDRKETNKPSKTPSPKKYIAFWDRVEGYINTSSKEQNSILEEIEVRGMGRGYMHSVVNLWMHVQYNIKHGLSKGVVGINEKNFDEQYKYQTELARINGYGQ